jgi:ABC-2 type transport system ATP-binding protein
MPAVEVSQLSYAYGRTEALHDIEFSVPDGAMYALLGPNGSGKTTLLQILMGLRHARAGRVALLGVDSRALSLEHRAQIGYIAEGQPLPGWMRLEQLEAYLAPLYPSWDPALAGELRRRFELDPRRRVGTLSRGEHMKAALLCALAPRPKLLLMDEPFTGMDALVKDDLVRGLLASAGSEGWTVVISSHDIGELELLADWVGFLAQGRMRVSEPMDALRERFRRVTVVADSAASLIQEAGDEWLSVERSGRRLTFVVPNATPQYESEVLRARFPGAQQIELHEASLREIFVALARPTTAKHAVEVAA